MKVVDSICQAAGKGPGEDRVGQSGNVIWIVDGATALYDDTRLPGISDVQWLVDFVGERLSHAGQAGYSGCAVQLLQKLSRDVTAELSSSRYPSDRVPPTCSIGMLITHESTVDMLRLGDVTCLAYCPNEIALTTDFFSKRESSAVAAAGGRGLTDPDTRRSMAERRWAYIRGSHGESVLSGVAAGLRYHKAVTIQRADVLQMLLCTDGFARAVESYGMYRTWRALVDDARTVGLRAIAERIRSLESTREEQSGHFKAMDDMAAALIVGDG